MGTDEVADAGVEAFTPGEAARVRASLKEVTEWRYTVAIDFVAESEPVARRMAAAMAEALGLLRVEVDTYTARLLARSGLAVAVFCTSADGPEGAFCGQFEGHGGWHVEPGACGHRWGDGDGAPHDDAAETVALATAGGC